MESTEQKFAPKQERVSLDETSAAKIDVFLDQVVQQVPGIKIGRSEIVRWLVNRHPETLATEELQQIKEAYFDEMEFALWMVRQLKESRARGERVSLSDLIGGVTPTRAPKKPRRKSPPPSTEAKNEEVRLE
jgi:hypothetical protein